METTTTTATTPPPPPPATTVQHITKASSDQLLTKFAELDSPEHHRSKKPKRQKRSVQSVQSIQSIPPVTVTKTRRESSEFSGGVLAERKSLLIPPPVVSNRRCYGFVRVGRDRFKSRSFRKRSFFGAIEKTWQRTLDGASKVFMEKQYNRHKRLLSDTS